MNRIYVSPMGADSNQGTLEVPLKTVQAAVDKARQAAKEFLSGPLTICLAGGTYELDQPVMITGDAPLTIAALPGETPLISGGRVLSDIQEGELNGMRLWTVDLPEVKAGKWFFHSLFAGGKRRSRAFLPREGFYWMEEVPGHTAQDPLFDGADCFVAREGDMRSFRNLTDVEIHAFHYWTDEHMPVASFDPETRRVVSTHRSVFALQDDQMPRFAKYRVEHVFEGLLEEGDWYLDRAEGRLYYLPEADERIDNTQLIAPVTEQLIVAKDVCNLKLEGIRFAYTDWSVYQNLAPTFPQFEGDDTLYASSPQGASNLPGVVSFENARRCEVIDCEVAHTGYYGVDLVYNCQNMRIQGNVMTDLGAGGVKLNGAHADQPREERTQYVTVADNDIGLGGRVFLNGIGVISLHANHIRIVHNHIHDLYYSGVSCGWIWGYRESTSFDNTMEYNHIHGLGHGILSDMGGIYTLSVQPGTKVRWNLIHDIEKANYGGWAIYPDEGSSHILIENNVSFDTSSSCFHQHYGRENIVRNNIWAFGREGMVAFTRPEEHAGFTFERNIVLTKGQPIYTGGGIDNIHADANLFWDVDGAPLTWARNHKKAEDYQPLDVLKEKGYDLNSVVADPKFVNAEAGDFTLAPDSPAFAMGFKPIDLTGVGVRPKEMRD